MKKVKDESEYLVYYYFEQCDKYKKLYEKCAVLMQIGSFFEIYGLSPDKHKGMDVQELSEILEIQCTKKNKSNPVIDIVNPLMCGFNCSVASKFIDILLDNGYTIILIEQTTSPPNPKREVTQIISPATRNIENSVENNYLMAIYFTTGTDKLKNKFINSSLSYIDINTNNSYIFETSEDDTKLNLEDIYKTIVTHKPSEVIIFTDNETKTNEVLIQSINDFIKTIPVSCIHNKINSIIDENFFKLNYQKAILQKIFKNRGDIGMLSVIEYLDIEKNPLSTICYTYLLQFCYDHSEKILEGINKPIFLENNKYLALINNVAENLNIISRSRDNSKNSSILNILNNCKTPIGKRYFKHCLLNPLTNINIIKERYDITEYFIQNNFYDDCIPILSNISDLERIFKRFITISLQPFHFLSINKSVLSVQELYKILINNNCNLTKICWSDINQNKLNSFVEYINNKFNFNEMDKVIINQINKNIFNIGIYPEIDEMEKQIIILQNIFENVCLCLNEGNENNNEFKLEINKSRKDIETRSIIVTKNRFETMLNDKKRSEIINKLLNEKCNLNLKDISSKSFSPSNKTTLKIFFKDMDNNQMKLLELQNELKNKIIELYKLELEYLGNEFIDLFKNIIEFIKSVDFYCNNAKNAVLNCYCKPNIVDCKEDKDSYIKTTKIRHPLIEKIQVDTPYISNDIEIGTENKKGMLLYGVNSSGKSSLMKSVGINLIMAQTGMYTASESFEFVPYDHIMSRVPSGDNILKGHSTFVSEINELRTILKRSTNKSLIIGDELMVGTESESAIALISSGIDYLSKKGSSFIFATHLHEVSRLESIKKINNINIYHLSVNFDKKNNIMIFDRILKDGNGEKLYGLEIAQSLDLPADFLLKANEIRLQYMGIQKDIIKQKISSYNSVIYMDKCSICDKDCDEVHHIYPQKDSNDKGLIPEKYIHKNRKSNLVNVCENCHDNIHADKIKVNDFKCTNKGIILDYIKNDNKDINKNIEDRVKTLRNNGISYNKIHNTIKNEFNESNISLYQIRKILA